MGGGSSNSNSGDTTNTKRYAPYIEAQHADFLTITAARRDTIINDSPFADYNSIDVNNAFFGLGYVISSFPSLQDMFGKHMAGLDIETLWSSTFNDIVSSSEVDETVAEEMKRLDDEIVKGELTDYQVSMRNLNAVSTSSFVLGKAMVEDKRFKAFAKISLDARAKLFSVAGKEYATRLNWEKKEITVYATTMKAYFMWKANTDNTNTTFDSRDSLWPFTVLDFERAALGTMESMTSWQKTMEARKRSHVSRVLIMAQGAATGASIGGQVGGLWGAVGGAVIGWQIGIAQIMIENNNPNYGWVGFVDPMVGSYLAQQD